MTMWIVCKIYGEVIVEETFEKLFEEFRSHLFERHGYHIHEANFIARDLIKKMIIGFDDQ